MWTAVKYFLTRRRLYGVWLFSLAVIGYLLYTDPDRGGSTRDMLQGLCSLILAFGAAHFLRKTLFEYVKLEKFVNRALQGCVASAIVVLAVIVFTAVSALIFSTRVHAATPDVHTYIPAGATKYCPILRVEQENLWPLHADPQMLCSLVEQESCITLTHRTCWNPSAKLKTDREEGAGFGQITRAYAKDGSVRMDALAGAKALEPTLSEWSWSNVYARPDLQLRAIVAMNRDCFRRLSRLVLDTKEALLMCDAAYNGGYGGLQSERRACGLAKDCNPQKWFSNVSEYCLKSKVVWQGYGQSACQINRGHVVLVARVRHDKYGVFFAVGL